MNNRILDNKDFILKNESDDTTLLKDIVVCYYNGNNWIIVPLNIMLIYPVIHDFYNEEGENIEISICVCPYTLAGCVFEGRLYPTNEKKNNFMIFKNEINKYITLSNCNIKEEKCDDSKKIKRWEINIKYFRNSISENPDPMYLYLKNKTNLNYIIPLDNYYTKDYIEHNNNKILSKYLVYLIQYKSSKDLRDKYSIVIGKDYNSNMYNGYNPKKSGYSQYLVDMEQKLREKSGFIIPILSKYAFEYYKSLNPKIIYL
jgi:hypothetical protein